jgi:hypothetical protein
VSWVIAAGLGALGGTIVSVVAFFNDVWVWYEERRSNLRRGILGIPKIAQFTDLNADALVLLTRMTIGALTGYLVHSEVAGFLPIIAAGASAPAILSQFGKNPVYSPGLEVGTTGRPGSHPNRDQAPELPEDPDIHAVSQRRGGYQPRHAKDGPSLALDSRVVPRQRVQPDGSQLSQGETEV